MNSWSIRRISSRSLSLAGRGGRYTLDRQLSDLGVELLDLQFVGRLAIPTSARVERPNRLILSYFFHG
ncbi:hypothetical protein [Bradyrhizobium ottawaense]|uniref:hypothetical protein n=1 Tax=Bradyrhizobium ottawaense TaxID=931866 RepID=UPI0015CF2969|nr:hypothetical protein [Bradyrhizobium ottawaense]